MTSTDFQLPAFRDAKPVQTSRAERTVLESVEAVKMGLKQYKAIGRKGDLSAILTSIHLEGTRAAQPALVLANRRDPVNRHVYVPLNNLWRYLAPDAMTAVVPELAQQLYGFVSKDDLFRVMDALYEYAEDLQKAPPPEWMTTSQWLAALAQDGMTITKDGQALNG